MRFILSLLSLLCLTTAAEAQTQTKILLEKLTATTCGWCPARNLTIDSLVSAHGEENVIMVQHHTGTDPMAIPFGNEISDEYAPGSPSLMLNRVKMDQYWNVSVPQFDWGDAMTEVAANLVDQLKITSTHTFNEETRKLTMDVEVTPVVNLNGDYRLNIYVVEDEVYRPDDVSYHQLNYWAGFEDHPYAGFPSLIAEYKHRKVVREIIGGPWGLNGSLPSSMPANTLVNSTFTYNIDEEIDESKMSYVVMVQKYDDDKFNRPIINAAEVFVNLPSDEIASGVEDVESAISIYPNPVQDVLVIDSVDEIESLRLFNSNGQEMMIDQISNGLEVGHLNKGWYIVQINTKNGSQHFQFIRD